MFMAFNANIERQFEFVQQQWINYGDSLFLGSDKDPIVGNSPVDHHGQARGQFRYWNESKGRLSVCKDIPRFVKTLGGDYFFLPGIRALSYLVTGAYERPENERAPIDNATT